MASLYYLKRTKQLGQKNVTGRRIRQGRFIHHPPLSQSELSRKLLSRGVDLDQTTISRIENQDRLVMDYELLAIARCLKVSLAWLCAERGTRH